MPSKSFVRVSLLAAAIVVLLGVFAGVSAGSGNKPLRATAPKLIAHDRSHAVRASLPGPRLLRTAPKRTLAGAWIPTTVGITSDMGRTQWVMADSTWYEVYSRGAFSRLAAIKHAAFWAGLAGPDAANLCATDPQGEPTISYDSQADRWVIVEDAFAVDSGGNAISPAVECVAVSTSSDATGTWNRYVFQISASLFPDQVKLGVWADGYYLSFMQFTSDGTYAGAGALAFERDKMLLGQSAQSRYFDLGNVTPALGGMLPADFTGQNTPTAGAPELYLQAHDDPLDIHDRLEVWSFHVDWTAPVTSSTFQPLANLPLNQGGFSIDTNFSCTVGGVATSLCLAQNGSSQLLDPFARAHTDVDDAQPQFGGHLQWGRSSGGTENMTAALTVNSGSNVAAPFWVRLSNPGSGWTISTEGVFAPADGKSRYLPSAAYDNAGNVGLAYVRTGGSDDPTTAYTNASDGTFGEQDIDPGTQPWTTDSEYGRYTSLTLDPVDLCTFWFAGPSTQPGMFSDAHFSFPGCPASASQVPVLTADPTLSAPLVREGLTITGAAATFTGATSTSYQWQRCDSNGLNCVDIPGETNLSHVMSASDASGDRTLRFSEIATNANGSSTAVSTSSTLVQSIPPVNTVRPVITGTAQVGQSLTTDNGSWTSSSPLSYTYRWRRCTGGSCANIAGATTSSYTLVASDLGDTVDAVVSATNTGGGTDANAVATAVVAAASSGGSSGGGGGSSGGGGGGGGGTMDLSVTGSQNPASVGPGQQVEYSLQANMVTSGQLALNVTLKVTLPTGVTYAASQSDRGNPCTANGQVVTCWLDFLSDLARVAHVYIWANATTAPPHSMTAVVSAQQSESSLTNNTLTLSDSTGTTTTTTTTTSTSTAGIPTGLNGATSSAKTDKVPPTAKALVTTAKVGTTAKLRFRIYDNSGVAKAKATIKKGKKVVGTAPTGFGPVVNGSVYFVGWHVPAKLAAGTYSYCVVATDRAKHSSKPSCSKLTVHH